MNDSNNRYGLTVPIAGLLLALGCALYIAFRPTTLLMFHWAKWVGLSSSVDTLRNVASGIEGYFPEWVIYSFPFAIWILSYQLFIDGIWQDKRTAFRHIWFWCIPVLAIASEIAQFANIIPGRFDLQDIIALTVASIVGCLMTNSTWKNKGRIGNAKEFG